MLVYFCKPCIYCYYMKLDFSEILYRACSFFIHAFLRLFVNQGLFNFSLYVPL